MDRVKIGVIGLGWISQSFVLPVLSKFADVELAAICDLDEERMKELGGRYGVKSRYRTCGEMLEAGNFDGVVVAVFPGLTAEIGKAFLEKGVSVYIEKPPGITLAETEALAAAAEKGGASAMVAFNRRYMPVVDLIRRELEKRGGLVQASMEFYKAADTDPSASETQFDPLVGTIIHGIDLLRYIGGEVDEARGYARAIGGPVNNSFTSLIRFVSGATGTVNGFWRAGNRRERYTFHGTDFSMYLESPDNVILAEKKVTRNLVPEPEMINGRAGAELTGYNDGFPQELNAFVQLLRNKEYSRSMLADAVKTMKLIARLREN